MMVSAVVTYNGHWWSTVVVTAVVVDVTSCSVYYR